MEMYPTEVTGHCRFVHRAPDPCACHFEHNNHGGGFQTPRQVDHPMLDQARRDNADLWDFGRTLGGRSGHRSPQRRPVFTRTLPCNGIDSGSPVCSYDLQPAVHCNCNRHCQPVREHCSYMLRNDARPFNFGIPHPLPHLQGKSQVYRPRRTVRYVSVEEEEHYNSEGCHFEAHSNSKMGHHQLPNGHCKMGSLGFEGVEERDIHQDWGGSEHGCNRHFRGFYKGFFSTEVPPKHFSPTSRKGTCVNSNGGGTQSLISQNGPVKMDYKDPEQVDSSKKKQDSVREQIRQVVTNLEGVLGGLKQVHVEMREVVEQIDRLTANIDLNEEAPSIAQGSNNNSNFVKDFRVANHRQIQMPNHENRIILRTNSPSPVHTAAVVKTNRILANNHSKLNGHPPQMYPMNHTEQAIQESPPHPQSLDPKVIIENRTSKPRPDLDQTRIQKPPLYPQNGRCGKNPSKPARTVVHSRRGQSSSVV